MPTALNSQQVVWLSVLATAGLVLMWWAFWHAVTKRQENIRDILLSPAFFHTVAVMGIIAATVVLTLAGRLKGEIAGTLLSGIVGYVLGQMTRHSGGGNDNAS